MPRAGSQRIRTIMLAALIALAPVAAQSQSGGGGGGGGGGGSSGGGSSGGSSAGGSAGGASAGGAAASRGSGGAASRAGSPAGRTGASSPTGAGAPSASPSTSAGAPNASPSTSAGAPNAAPTLPNSVTQPGGSIRQDGSTQPSLRNQTAPTTTPGYASPTQENTEQRAMELRNSAPPAPAPPEPGEDRGRTTDVGREPEGAPGAPGLPRQAGDERLPLNELSGGGSARQGAVGKTMAECEAAWDAETHMSKETWRDTCRRTLTAPHL